MFRKLGSIPNWKEEREALRESELAEFGDIKKYEVAEVQKISGNKPEFASIDAFYVFLTEEERNSFTFEELQELNSRLNIPQQEIITALLQRKISFEKRAKPPTEGRGFTSKENRWKEFR